VVRPRVSRAVGSLLVAALVLVGCSERHIAGDVVVGGGADAESAILAELYAAALRYYRTAARVERSADPLARLDTGDVRVVPGFTGRLLETFAPSDTAISDADVYRAMVAALPEGVAAGDYATAAEDKPALAVTAATAATWGGPALTARVKNCPAVQPGTVADSAATPTRLGTCKLPAAREFKSVTELFDTLRAKRVNAAWITTATTDIPADVDVLADDTPQLVRAENVVPLYRRNELSERELLAVNEIAGDFDTAALTDLRRQVARGADPRQAAEGWLAAHPLGH
jgi:glycine betaine/choline ABC-type transport system substrate-binding protein